ncbi:MAG: hypothetical protein PHX44_00315 [Sulfurimonas sp.]|uniref:hypothetical protein n=1 Tax=Sulfurimonas sp. TaxID=2022749 RepID=UPI00261B7288|nr:hypothetical protein [Sulfurimonas sp.]MDD2651479.1 hypothetical protein [Sulfurimonas sp.]MDD3451020.1 hypothetical protein [Sulfurimonas sp.]
MKTIYGYFFPNPTKKLLKSYFFWVDFVHGIKSTEDFKKKLQNIQDVKVYKNSYGRFFLNLQEASSQSEQVEEISIKEVLASETYPLFLLTRLERITLYDKDDLKNIPKSSQLIWTTIKDIEFHMILDNDKLIYPKENPFRFGYQIFRDSHGLLGVYDVETEHLALPFEYKYIKAFGNILIISHNEKEYFIYDLKTKRLISQVKDTLGLSDSLKAKIDLSKIELSSYLELIPTLKTQSDLMNYGLWGAKVWAMEVPSGYEEILADANMGTIEWNQYCSADIFDMSIELPVNFKKKNGEYVSVGIKHEYLTLDGECRERLSRLQDIFTESSKTERIKSFEDLLVRGNLPDDDRVVPNYLKIKNSQYDDVDFSNNTVNEIVLLTSDEFNELVSSSDNGLLFTYLATLSKKELERFYDYNDRVVKLADGAEMSSREQFESAMAGIDMSQMTAEQRARATLEMPLMINFAKHIYHKITDFLEYARADYFDFENETFMMYEGHLSKIIWDEMKYIPNHFEQVLEYFQGFYDENNEEHRTFFAHLCQRFGLLIATLNRLVVITENRDSSLNWFTGKMVEYELVGSAEISLSQSKTLTTDKKLINFLTLMFAGICDENEENYLSNLIYVVEALFEWYPVNRVACEYAMVEMMKSVALKKVNVQNANAFIAFFEELPRFYEVLSFEKIMELKELVNHTLATYKPQDNEIFENKEVKNKLILLNYLIDMEDLYYDAGKK